jgi:hypothetical protein
MTLLDCESIDSIYGSLEAIAGAKRSAIESFLDSMDLDALYNSNSPPSCPVNDYLLDAFRKNFRSNLSYDATCWFHRTRVVGDTNFEAGILPLGQQLDSIWDFLHSLVRGAISEKQWRAFRQEKLQSAHHLAHLYAMKTEKPFYWGPYAILVRDIAFKPKEVGNHDYLFGPEIVEDICICFEKVYKFDLLTLFRKSTKPCIVKFVDSAPRSKYLRAAIFYLYVTRRHDRLRDYCNDCLDARGAAVSRDRILKVEFPAYEPDPESASEIARKHSGEVGVRPWNVDVDPRLEKKKDESK